MRQHVLQVRKSQDMHHGIMGIRRILLGGPMGTEDWCTTLSETRSGACAAGRLCV